MIAGTSLTIQLAAAIAHDLFDTVGPLGASALRFGLGAMILLAITRPALRGRDARTWWAIAAYGVALAALNLTFFQAISLIPLGIAVTLAFVAPLAMALVASRSRRDIVWALLAAIGVVTLGGIDRPESVAGILFAIAAGCAWVAVAYAGRSGRAASMGSRWRSRLRRSSRSRSGSGMQTLSTPERLRWALSSR